MFTKIRINWKHVKHTQFNVTRTHWNQNFRKTPPVIPDCARGNLIHWSFLLSPGEGPEIYSSTAINRSWPRSHLVFLPELEIVFLLGLLYLLGFSMYLCRYMFCPWVYACVEGHTCTLYMWRIQIGLAVVSQVWGTGFYTGIWVSLIKPPLLDRKHQGSSAGLTSPVWGFT